MSTTMIIQPGPVLDFLIANQNARDSVSLDWVKAKRVLKNLRVKTTTANQEFKITGLMAPIGYAHLAAAQVGQWMKFKDTSETSSSQGGLRNASPVAVPQLPPLEKNVASPMFFC
ncbi:hypothetical protein KY289_028276 [Solanum tuberosum]|nr:hypothetical protein KY289_028276 [Solanum tuberosum]